MTVTTRGGKQTINPLMPVDDDDAHEKIVKRKNAETGDEKAKDGVSNKVVTPRKLEHIPRPPTPFP